MEEEEKTIIQKAETLAQRIERGNKEYEELIKRNEEASARNILGGKSEAGTVKPKENIEKDEIAAHIKQIMDSVRK